LQIVQFVGFLLNNPISVI